MTGDDARGSYTAWQHGETTGTMGTTRGGQTRLAARGDDGDHGGMTGTMRGRRGPRGDDAQCSYPMKTRGRHEREGYILTLKTVQKPVQNA